MDLDRSPRRFPAPRLGLARVLVAWLSLLVSQGRAQPLNEWTLIDIANPGGSRIATVEGTCLTMETSNTAPNHGIEHGGFLYHELAGDGAIEVQVERLVRSGFAELPFLALELRYSELAGSPLAACAVRAGGGWLPWLAFRDPSQATLREEPIPPPEEEDLLQPPNMILRLERRGDSVTALSTRDRTKWFVLGEHRMPGPVPETLLAGVFVHTRGNTLFSTFCDLHLEAPAQLLPVVDWEPVPDAGFVGREMVFEARAVPPAAESDVVGHFWTLPGVRRSQPGRRVTQTFERSDLYHVRLDWQDLGGRLFHRRNTAYVLREPQSVGPWQHVDLLGVDAGGVTLRDDCIDIVGRGTLFFDGSDQSTLLYQEVHGDVLLETRIASASEQLGSPAFGLMIRESLDHRSRQAHLTCRLDGPHFTPYLLSRKHRGYLEVLDGVLPQGTAPPTPPELWLRLARQGSTVVAQVSGDAVRWSELGRTTFEPPLAETLLVGLSVTPTCGGGLDCTEPLEVTFCETRLEGDVVARAPRFRRGDVDASGRLSITDAILVYRHLFKGEAAPSCEDAADTNDDGVLNLTDVAVIVGYLFRGASEPVSPGPLECGEDADATDALRPCEEGCR